jgi:hypothetical protein
MKALDVAPATPKLRHSAKPEAKKPTLADQLSGLADKFRIR